MCQKVYPGLVAHNFVLITITLGKLVDAHLPRKHIVWISETVAGPQTEAIPCSQYYRHRNSNIFTAKFSDRA